MGAKRREHHRREEGMRAAGIEATRQRLEMERQQRAYQDQLNQQREQMLAQTRAMREATAPTPTSATLSARGLGVRSARSQRGTVRGLSKGLASLRIPLNIGGGAGGGLNIG